MKKSVEMSRLRLELLILDIGNILNNKYTYILLVLIGIGIFLRFYHLGFNSLWLDESTNIHYG